MNLTGEQLGEFDEAGHVLVPGHCNDLEIAVLKAAAEEAYARVRDEVWRGAGGAPRTAFVARTCNGAFRQDVVTGPIPCEIY